MSDDFAVQIMFNDILERLGATEREADQMVRGVALELRNRVVRAIQERSPSDGPQTRYNPKRTVHPASKGFPPNTDTGNLVNSVQIEPVGPLTQKMLVGAEYALPLELNGHPFVVPAAEELRQELPEFVQGLIEAVRGE